MNIRDWLRERMKCEGSGRSILAKKDKVRVSKLKNGKAIGKDEVTGEMIKGGGNWVVNCIWRVCNMLFESGFVPVPEDWRYAVIVSLYKGKGERNLRIIEVLAC